MRNNLRRLNFFLSRFPFIRRPFRWLRGLFLGDKKWQWEVHDWAMDGFDIARKTFHSETEMSFSQKGVFIKAVDGLEYKFDIYPGISGLYHFLKGQPSITPEAELELILDNLNPKSVVIDVGAGLGDYSLNMAKGSPDVKIYCLEPTGHSYAMLRDNVERNKMEKNISCHRLALADKEGEFEITPIGEGNYLDLKNKSGGKREAVKVSTLDKFVSENKIARVDFIKSDVEGADFLVLKGGERTLKSMKPNVFLEVVDYCAKRFGYSYEEVFDYMADLGYDYVLVSEAENKILKPDGIPLSEQIKMAYNFFFYHKTKPIKLRQIR